MQVRACWQSARRAARSALPAAWPAAFLFGLRELLWLLMTPEFGSVSACVAVCVSIAVSFAGSVSVWVARVALASVALAVALGALPSVCPAVSAAVAHVRHGVSHSAHGAVFLSRSVCACWSRLVWLGAADRQTAADRDGGEEAERRRAGRRSRREKLCMSGQEGMVCAAVLQGVVTKHRTCHTCHTCDAHMSERGRDASTYMDDRRAQTAQDTSLATSSGGSGSRLGSPCPQHFVSEPAPPDVEHTREEADSVALHASAAQTPQAQGAAEMATEGLPEQPQPVHIHALRSPRA